MIQNIPGCDNVYTLKEYIKRLTHELRIRCINALAPVDRLFELGTYRDLNPYSLMISPRNEGTTVSIDKGNFNESKDPYCSFLIVIRNTASWEGDVIVERRDLHGHFSKVKLECFPDEKEIEKYLRLTFIQP